MKIRYKLLLIVSCFIRFLIHISDNKYSLFDNNEYKLPPSKALTTLTVTESFVFRKILPLIVCIVIIKRFYDLRFTSFNYFY